VLIPEAKKHSPAAPRQQTYIVPMLAVKKMMALAKNKTLAIK